MHRSYSYVEAQDIWARVNRVCDTVTRLKVVRVLRAYKEWNTGGGYWYPEMNDSVGHTYTLRMVCPHSVIINGHYYPFYVLEIVK